MSLSVQDTEAFRRIIAADPECKQCFECGAPSPQWCDVNHGIFVCLECSGVHRSLGTHLSFVRSSTMDTWASWRPEKLRQMQVGGNRRARLYFEANAVPKMPVKARYESLGALRYTSLLEAEATGQPFSEATWQPPEWYSRMKNQQQQSSPNAAGVYYGGYGSPTTQSSPTGGDMSNCFTGMGSSPAPARQTAGAGAGANNRNGGGDWYSAVSSGWGALTQKASELAHTAQENLAQTDVDGMKASVARGWTSVASTVSTYAKQAGLEGEGEGDGLSALLQHARQEREAQPQQAAVPGRFDHIEHVASPTSQQDTGAVASGWGGGGGSSSNSATSPTARAGNPWQTTTPSAAWGTTTAVRPATTPSPTSPSSKNAVLTGKPVQPQAPVAPQKKDDDWGWDD